MISDINLDFFEHYSGEKAERIVFLIHGYGANGKDLINLAEDLSQYLPNTLFISPNAHLKFEGGNYSNAYQWFSLWNHTESYMANGLKQANPVLLNFIRNQCDRVGINNFALLGFSQGAMLALYTGLKMEPKPKCLLCYSGALVSEKSFIDGLAKGKPDWPKIMLIHGDADQVVAVVGSVEAEKVLRDNGIEVKMYIEQGLGHSISKEGVKRGGEFLSSALY